MKNRIPMKRTMKHTTKHAMKRTMKRTMKHFAIATVLGLGLALTACASDDDDVTPTGTYQDGGGQDSGAGQATPAATPAPTNQPTDTTANVQGAFEPERDLTGFINFAPTKGALANQLAPPAVGEEFAIIHTNFGEIHLRLFPDIAPMAVQNFTTHARNGFYDDLIFHRVMYNFMIQGGCSLGTGTGGQSIWGRGFGDEVTTDLRHIRGALSMANTGAPFSNGSQFFIVHIVFSPLMQAFILSSIGSYRSGVTPIYLQASYKTGTTSP